MKRKKYPLKNSQRAHKNRISTVAKRQLHGYFSNSGWRYKWSVSNSVVRVVPVIHCKMPVVPACCAFGQALSDVSCPITSKTCRQKINPVHINPIQIC